MRKAGGSTKVSQPPAPTDRAEAGDTNSTTHNESRSVPALLHRAPVSGRFDRFPALCVRSPSDGCASMDEQVNQYRRRAEEAERKADTTTDPEAKRAYVRLAASYKELAQLSERSVG